MAMAGAISAGVHIPIQQEVFIRPYPLSSSSSSASGNFYSLPSCTSSQLQQSFSRPCQYFSSSSDSPSVSGNFLSVSRGNSSGLQQSFIRHCPEFSSSSPSPSVSGNFYSVPSCNSSCLRQSFIRPCPKFSSSSPSSSVSGNFYNVPSCNSSCLRQSFVRPWPKFSSSSPYSPVSANFYCVPSCNSSCLRQSFIRPCPYSSSSSSVSGEFYCVSSCNSSPVLGSDERYSPPICRGERVVGLAKLGALSSASRGLWLKDSLLGQLHRDCWSSSRSLRARTPGRRRACTNCSSGGRPATVSVSDEPNVSELPCLPFTPAEVFVPSSKKVLHLYEARFLALLEEVVGKYDNMFAHIVIEPMSSPEGDDESKGVASFLATYGCLARVEKVKRLEIGAEVTIRGIGRIKIISLTQLEPFLKGTVIALKDEVPKDKGELASAIEGLQATLSTVQNLQIKLKVSKDELLQTPLERALQWAEKGEPDEVAGLYLPSREERLSFAALQPVAGASPAERHKLLQERLFAMEAMNTLQRLNRVRPFVQQTLASLAAKVSLQSLKF